MLKQEMNGTWSVVDDNTGEVTSNHPTHGEAQLYSASGSSPTEPFAPLPTQVQTAMEAAGIPWDARMPEQQFRQYAGQQFQPGLNYLRSAFYGMQDPLMQQYYLGAPQMEQPFGGFGQFMGQRGAATYGDAAAWNPYSYTAPESAYVNDVLPEGWAPSLRGMAARASAAASLTPGQFLQYVDPQAGYAGPEIDDPTRGLLGSLTPEQQLWYRRVYGTSEESEANRMALANLMALQRSPVDGVAQPMYGGALGQAVTGALNEMYSQVMARDPGANFLDWYMQRTVDRPGAGGFLTRTATT